MPKFTQPEEKEAAVNPRSLAQVCALNYHSKLPLNKCYKKVNPGKT